MSNNFYIIDNIFMFDPDGRKTNLMNDYMSDYLGILIEMKIDESVKPPYKEKKR